MLVSAEEEAGATKREAGGMSARIEAASMSRATVLDSPALGQQPWPATPRQVDLPAALLGQERVPAASPPMSGRGTAVGEGES